jgi:hypothetical protein
VQRLFDVDQPCRRSLLRLATPRDTTNASALT